MNMLTTLTAASAADVALTLSDGTPVDFSKITSKDNIQVRLPSDHDLGDDPLRIFRRDGTHYKDQLDVTLTAAPKTAAPAPASPGSYIVDGQTFTSLADAQNEAFDLYRETGDNITIYKQIAVGTVGFTPAA